MMRKVQGLIFAVFSLFFHYYFIFPLRYVVSIAPMVSFLSPILGLVNALVVVWVVALLFQVRCVGLEFGIKTTWCDQISLRRKLSAFVKATSWWSKCTFRYTYLVTTYLLFG